MQSFYQHIFILVWKDFLIDIRRKDNLLSMILFLFLSLLIFYFAIGEKNKLFISALPGLIWFVFLMTGTLGFVKSFVLEMETGCMGGLLTSPVDRSVLFLGKMFANTLFLLITQLLFIPSIVFLFEIEVKSWLELFLVLLLGTFGFSSLGTLLTALTLNVKGKEILLPILMFPLMIPCLLCVVRLTESLFFLENQEEVWQWWKLIFCFYAVLFTISIL